MVAVFYVIFGLLTVGQETLLQWTTLDPDTFSPLLTLEFLGSPIIVTKPLLVVSGIIAAFSGLQFSVSLVTDATYRDSFSTDLRAELRQMLAVRCRMGQHVRLVGHDGVDRQGILWADKGAEPDT